VCSIAACFYLNKMMNDIRRQYTGMKKRERERDSPWDLRARKFSVYTGFIMSTCGRAKQHLHGERAERRFHHNSSAR
jgi:hypothetical protein